MLEKLLFVILGIVLLSNVIPFVHAQAAGFSCGRLFTGGPGIPRPLEWEYNLPYVWTFNISSQQYQMSYDGQITNATAKIEGRSIEFTVQPDPSKPENPVLPVRLPRVLIDSQKNGNDIPFTVIVNGRAADNVTEDVVPSTGDRMLCIPLPTGESPSTVQIIGTTIAPEFGSFVIILASTILAGIIVFRVIYQKRLRYL